MDEKSLLTRITANPAIFGGKPIIRCRGLAVEHVLGMLAAGDAPETILEGYPWLEAEDIRTCLVYARRLVGRERVEPLVLGPIPRGSRSTPAPGTAPSRSFRPPATI